MREGQFLYICEREVGPNDGSALLGRKRRQGSKIKRNGMTRGRSEKGGLKTPTVFKQKIEDLSGTSPKWQWKKATTGRTTSGSRKILRKPFNNQPKKKLKSITIKVYRSKRRRGGDEVRKKKDPVH